MINKLKCFFGFHDFKRIDDVKRCKRCKQIVIVVGVIFADDARELGASEEAISRGYVTKGDFE